MTWLLAILFGLLGGLGAKFGIELWRERRALRRVLRLEIDANAALRRADPEFAAFLLDNKPGSIVEYEGPTPSITFGQLLADRQAHADQQMAMQGQLLAQMAASNSQASNNLLGAAMRAGSRSPLIGGLGMTFGGPMGAVIGGLFGGLSKPKDVQ